MTLALGFQLSSEEQSPADLVRHAQKAEDGGFELHQVGREQKGFVEFYEQEIVPERKSTQSGRRAAERASQRQRAR